MSTFRWHQEGVLCCVPFPIDEFSVPQNKKDIKSVISELNLNIIMLV
jgi:hypothetical protein